MTKKYKAGDKVRVVQTGSNSFLKLDAIHTVEHDRGGVYMAIKLVGSDVEYDRCRFEPATANGVDADDNPILFESKDLKPFMRCVAKDGVVYVVIADDRIADATGFIGHGVLQEYVISATKQFTIMAVYEAPVAYNTKDAIDPDKKGKLVWKRASYERVTKRKQLQADIAAAQAALEAFDKED